MNWNPPSSRAERGLSASLTRVSCSTHVFPGIPHAFHQEGVWSFGGEPPAPIFTTRDKNIVVSRVVVEHQIPGRAHPPSPTRICRCNEYARRHVLWSAGRRSERILYLCVIEEPVSLLLVPSCVVSRVSRAVTTWLHWLWTSMHMWMVDATFLLSSNNAAVSRTKYLFDLHCWTVILTPH